MDIFSLLYQILREMLMHNFLAATNRVDVHLHDTQKNQRIWQLHKYYKISERAVFTHIS